MLEWSDDLKIRGTGIYLDSRKPRPLCVVSHAHGDHIGVHERAIATPATAAMAEHRIGLCGVTELAYGVDHDVEENTRIRLLPAGHVLGSAMVHVTRPEGTLLYTGDFKLRRCLTADCAEPQPADCLVMESTYGLPHFRFPPREQVAAQLVELCESAIRDNRQAIVMGYSLGKAQELTRILTDAGLNVTLHGAPHTINGFYEKFGVALGAYRRYRFEDFHGDAAQRIDLRERGVLVAPPYVARTAFVTRFENPVRIVATGWALLKNAIYRYGVDHAVCLSDHADFDELLELIERVKPRKIFTHHGYKEFVQHLRARGMDAELARPDEQLSLFG
ncbi:MAG: putative mRNA 3-end processing factor [Humisphaera sp.]|nr:putative mRNA 3-end processing factor [Humisphaera sp.]